MSEGNDQQYRDSLARKIKAAPKEKRQDVLDEAQGDPQYWQSRNEQIKQLQDEKPIEDGMGIFLKKKTLFHGSSSTDIDEFLPAEETTVGTGIYFTSETKDAIGYAQIRAQGQKGSTPVLYEASVEDMRMLDLRKIENATKVMESFKLVLERWLQQLSPDKFPTQLQFEVVQNSVQKAIGTIEEGRYDIGSLRNVVFNPQEGINLSDLFTKHVQSLGYDGLIAFEGGEGSLVKNHDTYLVFDPKKARINREHKIT